MLRLGLYLSVSLLAATLLGCGSETGSDVNSIIGSLDLRLLTIEQNDESPNYAAVGNLMASLNDPEHPERSFAIPYCTAIAIGTGYFLTAGHCEKDSVIVDQKQIAKAPETNKIEVHTFDEQLRLYYGGKLIEEASESTSHEKVKFVYQSKNYDFAVFYDPSWQQGSAINIFESVNGKVDGAMEIVGHPHGLPKAKADNCHLKHRDDDGYIYHDCDSLSGVSGGLLINGGHAVGIHIQATAPNSGSFYRENSSFESSEQLANYFQCETDCPEYLGYNVGLSFESVGKDLKANAYALMKTIQGESKCGN